MLEIINSILTNLEDYQQRSETDYIAENGLLYCGECHTSKQFVIELFGQKRTVPVACQCAQQRYEAQKARQKAEEEMMQIQTLRRIGITDKQYANITFAEDDGQDTRMSNICTRYVQNFAEIEQKNIGLILYGECDTGKTFFASAIANELINKRKSCMITSCVSLVSAIQADFGARKEEILYRIANVRLLVLDDFGVERQSDFVKQTLYEIIDARYRARKPLIVTTNITLEQLKNPPDLATGRIYDRLIEMCTPVQANGKHRRREYANNKYRDAKDILGI